MYSVSRPLPSTETTAVPTRPLKATIGAMLSGIASRSRRRSPAAKTIISTAPSTVIEWKANITGTLSLSASATPWVLPSNSEV